MTHDKAIKYLDTYHCEAEISHALKCIHRCKKLDEAAPRISARTALALKVLDAMEKVQAAMLNDKLLGLRIYKDGSGQIGPSEDPTTNLPKGTFADFFLHMASHVRAVTVETRYTFKGEA
jgi:hypothetical protein